MRYLVIVKKSAEKEVKSLPLLARRRIEQRLLSLETNPRPEGSKKLVAGEHMHRVRVGDYRVVYDVDDRRRVVDVLRVAHRRDVYR